jgi:hypothetical protein
LEDMHLAARARIESVYSWDNVADRYLAAFAKTLDLQQLQPRTSPVVSSA